MPRFQNFPPGPPGQPLLGSLVTMNRDILRFFRDVVDDYGDTVGFYALRMPFCLLAHPDQIEQVLVRDSHSFTKSFDYRIMAFVLGQGLLTSEGEVWRRQRQLTQPIFHADRVKSYVPIFVQRSATLAADLRDSSEVDIHDEMMRLTLLIVAEALFHSVVDEDVLIVRDALDAVAGAFEGFPVPLWLPFPSHVRLWRHLRRLDRLMYRLIAQRRSAPTDSNDLLDRLLAVRDEQGRQMSEKQLRDELLTVFLAGHETTAIALSYALWLIARHPAVEEQLQQEWSRVLQGRSVTADDVPQLVYTKAVLQEAMRLYPPAWVIGRETTDVYSIGGYTLPRGTTIFVSQYLTQRDARFFEDPEEFRPERWLDASAEKHPRYAYLPFGAGPRSCIGAGFAMLEMTCVLPTLLREVHFEAVDDAIELLPAITLRPRSGIRLRVASDAASIGAEARSGGHGHNCT
jgi:cytochrome P450